MTCEEGRDGTHPRYAERLLAPWWVWLVGIGFTVAVAVAYGYALGPLAAALAAVAVGGGVAALLLATSATLRVDECVLRAGRARLPLRHVGTVEVLDAEASARARTLQFDPRAFVLLRTWSSPLSVRVKVTDPADPHPYWLLTARNPQSLAAALVDGPESAAKPVAPAPDDTEETP